MAKDINIRYDADLPEIMNESIELAKQEYEKLIFAGEHRFVQIVISNNPYSEGVWLEASQNLKKPGKGDTIIKLYENPNYKEPFTRPTNLKAI